jgi:hypothetical protein
MNRLTVIIPTTYDPAVIRAVESVLAQTVPVDCFVVVDVVQEEVSDEQFFMYNTFRDSMNGLHNGKNIYLIELPYNTGTVDGKVKYYGHRIYAGVPNFVNTEFVSFLDQDNWLEPNFSEEMLKLPRKWLDSLDIVTCRRNIYASTGEYIGVDNFESVPGNFHDTNTFMFRTKQYCKHLAHAMAFGEWGADRELSKSFDGPQGYEHTHTSDALVNYTSPARLDEFFRQNIQKDAKPV